MVFHSDSLQSQPGFHATFVFEAPNRTVIQSGDPDASDRVFQKLEPVLEETTLDGKTDNVVDDDGKTLRQHKVSYVFISVACISLIIDPNKVDEIRLFTFARSMSKQTIQP